MRAMTEWRRRLQKSGKFEGGKLLLFFGARTPDSLPYFGPLGKVPDKVLKKHMVFSRVDGQDKEYVQDRMMVEQEEIADMIADTRCHVYICGLKGMEDGVERAFTTIAESIGEQWVALRDVMRGEGRYHVETY